MQNLTTVPTFTFKQGKQSKDSFEENPITVSYYNNGINLTQEGAYNEDESIMISPKHLSALFKAIKQHLPEATKWLDKHTG